MAPDAVADMGVKVPVQRKGGSPGYSPAISGPRPKGLSSSIFYDGGMSKTMTWGKMYILSEAVLLLALSWIYSIYLSWGERYLGIFFLVLSFMFITAIFTYHYVDYDMELKRRAARRNKKRKKARSGKKTAGDGKDGGENKKKKKGAGGRDSGGRLDTGPVERADHMGEGD